jgi:phosphohistidine phosphatase
MRLYFLRHGQAVSRAEWREDDALRPLTGAGRTALQREGRALAALGLGEEIEVIVTSPLARAKETAEIVAAELGLGELVVTDERLAHGFTARHARALAGERAQARAIMLVGHEPDFSTTISALIGGGAVACKKGGLARLDASDAGLGDAELVWLLPPRALGA